MRYRQARLKDWVALGVLALPTLLVSIDVSVMILALPHISAGLGASSTEQLWIMDMYGFMLAGFMVTMGTLGDRIGRRKLLLIGASGFCGASILAAFSTTPHMLIASRALLGIAGATLAPSILALISNIFADPRQRSLAISIWLVSFMGGMAVGPLVGGAFLEHFWWGAVFLLGVPVMLLLLISGPLLLPEYRAPHAGALDLPSVGLSLATILPLIFGLKELAEHGPAPLPLLAMAVGLALGALFVRRQRTVANPLVDLRLFQSRAFCTALGGMFGVTLTGALMLFISQYLQFVEGLSPLHAGLWMLPAVVASMTGFLVSPLLARRLRPARLIAGGLCISIVGAALFTQVPPAAGLPLVVLAYAIWNLGAAPLVSLSTDLVVGAAPPDKAGSAASLSETSAELAFALGIAILGSLGAAVYSTQIGATLPPELASGAVRDSIAGALVAADPLAEPAGSLLRTSASVAFTSAFHVVAATCAVILLTVSLSALRFLGHVPPIGQTTSAQPAAAAHHPAPLGGAA